MWSLVYLLVRTLVTRMIGIGRHGRDDGAKDLEILVLRHQLRVLQRTTGRPQLRTIDRVLPFDPLLRVQFRFPIGEGAGVSLLHEHGRVLEVRYSESYCDVEAEVPTSLKEKLARFVS